ncbi:hypothetical protein D3C76_606640 [compost metagenome]
MGLGMMQALDAGHQLGQAGFVGTAAAEVFADRCNQFVLVGEQQLAQAFQPLPALRQWRHRVASKRLALGVELGGKVFNGSRRQNTSSIGSHAKLHGIVFLELIL